MNAPVELSQLPCSNSESGHFLPGQLKLDLARNVKNASLAVHRFDLLKKYDAKQSTRSKSGPIDVDAYCCSSLSSSSDSSLTFGAQSKKVCFATDKEGRVHCEIFKNYAPRNRKEVQASWYTPSQFMSFRKDARKEAIMMQKSSYVQNFAAVYEACNKGNFKTVTKERAYISAASCRGLEVVVFPTLYNDRKNAIQTVLKTQVALPNDMPLEKRHDALASASRFLSKKSRQLARVLGSGDAAVVVANERITAAAQKSKSVEVPQLFISKK